MMEEYGPHKPARVTVRSYRFRALIIRETGMRWIGTTFKEWLREQGADPEAIWQDDTQGIYRLTFRDDWAAAEFALRWA